MRTRYLVSGLVAAAFLSAPAFAQTSSTNPPPAATATAPKLASPHWRSSKMIGVNIYNEQNEKLGDINEIILDASGKVLGYVIGVGGFLGMSAMDNATRNAGEMIRKQTITYNRTRQAMITKELIEIISGAEAL